MTSGREIAERRRSSAAGTHGKKSKDRANTEREALELEQTDNEGSTMTVTTRKGTTYPVEAVEIKDGQLMLKARQPSGKLKWIKNAEVHTGEMHRVLEWDLNRRRAERKSEGSK